MQKGIPCQVEWGILAQSLRDMPQAGQSAVASARRATASALFTQSGTPTPW